MALTGILRRWWLELLMGAGYLAGDLVSSLTGQPHVVTFNDSATYLVVNLTGASGRLWFVPLVYSLVGSDHARVILQTVIGACSWLALAAVVARSFSLRSVRVVGVAVVFLVALTPEVVQWNRAILSESLAISATVCLVAASIWLSRRRTWPALIVWILAVTAWTFSRQVQALIVVVLVVPLVLGAFRLPKARAVLLSGSAAVVLIAGWGVYASLQATSISRFNAVAILRYRAETHPSELRYLQSRGLPMVAPLRSPIPFGKSGLPVNVNEYANPADMTHLLSNSRLVKWVEGRWDGVYAGYLIGHPASAFGPPIANAPTLMTVNPDYVAGGSLPAVLVSAIYGTSPGYLLVLFGLAVVAAVAAAVRRRFDRTMWLLVIGLVFVYGWCAAVWNLSASELPRLYDPEAVVTHLLLDLLLLVAIDRWWGGRSTTRRSQERTDRSAAFDAGTPDDVHDPPMSPSGDGDPEGSSAAIASDQHC